MTDRRFIPKLRLKVKWRRPLKSTANLPEVSRVEAELKAKYPDSNIKLIYQFVEREVWIIRTAD
jgi:hypothetical protein